MPTASDTAALLAQAVQLHQQGRLDDAQALYRQVLAANPRQSDALHLSGVVERQRGNAALAVDLIGQALAVDPRQPRAHCNLGAALGDLGRQPAALAAYDAALRLDPHYALAWDNRGNTLRRLGRLAEALDSHERSLALDARSAPAWRHRALVLADLGRHADAAASAEQALLLRPKDVDALLVLGNAHQAQDHLDAALAAYARALALDAARADVWCAQGAALKKAFDLDGALASYDRALALDPQHAQAALFRANTLRALGRTDDALAAYWHAAGLGADREAIALALAALGVAEAPAAAPATYVKALFDQYAGHFDRHLVDVLDYRTPTLLDALLRPHVTARVEAALDLGCGTGLSGQPLRPLARRLAGVDLSPRMLDGARATGLYDELACSSIEDFLRTATDAWDVIAAADVLVYFGDLAPLFALVAAALRQGGLFVFSCEALEAVPGARPARDGYTLRPSNRYAHARAYVLACAREAGLGILDVADGELRREQGVPVEGHLFLLRR